MSNYILFMSIVFFSINTNGNVISILGLIASITSIVNVLQIAEKKYSNFYGGIVSCLSYGLYAGFNGYVGDALLNFLGYLPGVFFGMYKGGQHKENTIVKKKSFKPIYILYICIGYSVAFISGYFLIPVIGDINGGYKFEKNSYQHILDASTNSLGIIGTMLMTNRLTAQYIAYIISNPLNITMGIIMFDINMIIVYSIYLLTAIIGLYHGINVPPLYLGKITKRKSYLM